MNTSYLWCNVMHQNNSTMNQYIYHDKQYKDHIIDYAVVNNNLIEYNLIEELDDAYLVVNFKGKILHKNQKALSMLNYAIEEDFLNLDKCILPYGIQNFIKLYKKLTKDRFVLNHKMKLHLQNVSIKANLIYDKKKNPIAVQCFLHTSKSATSNMHLKHFITDLSESFQTLFQLLKKWI